MTRSNRIANRTLILLVGIVAIATGLALGIPRFGSALSISLPKFSAPTPTALGIALGACVVVVGLAVAWIVTRGRGRTARLLSVPNSHGSITIDSRVAADLIADALAGNRDIVSVGSGSYSMRRQSVLSLRVVTRKGVDLPELIQSVGHAVDELDGVLERRVPVLLQIVSGRIVREVRTR
jgi:hypothetical protein